MLHGSDEGALPCALPRSWGIFALPGLHISLCFTVVTLSCTAAIKRAPQHTC